MIRVGERTFVYVEAGYGGFRVFGCGLSWKDTTRRREYWTERNHSHRQLRLGRWLIVPMWRGKRLRRSA